MSKEHVAGERESSRSYSRAVKVRGGTTVYLAGVGGANDPSLAGNFAGQTHAAFERLRANLADAGGTLDDIVTMTVFITDSRYGDEFVALRKSYFSKGYPASALIGVHSLARPEMLLEIQAIAVVDD
jgi:enamine deaminase RidA (YjgF/YER057c/UK114 family)